MLEPLTDLPDGVIGFEAVGEIVAADYTGVLLPTIERAAEHGAIRLVYVLGERFDGYSGGAAWQDMRLGLAHHGKWQRTALVTDADWVSHLASLFGWMFPGDFEHFPLSGRDEAIAWAAAD
jgi:hypothetical protein